jgi:hypothetical protein
MVFGIFLTVHIQTTGAGLGGGRPIGVDNRNDEESRP